PTGRAAGHPARGESPRGPTPSTGPAQTAGLVGPAAEENLLSGLEENNPPRGTPSGKIPRASLPGTEELFESRAKIATRAGSGRGEIPRRSRCHASTKRVGPLPHPDIPGEVGDRFDRRGVEVPGVAVPGCLASVVDLDPMSQLHPSPHSPDILSEL